MRNNPWTGKEEKTCSTIYTTEGLQAAMDHTGRTKYAVQSKMNNIGVKCADSSLKNLKPRRRAWYAEEAAQMIEFAEAGVSNKIIAEFYSSTGDIIRGVINAAKRYGFDRYPKRVL